jgi:UDP-N-acetylmuramoylalanine--D-glutamate ligase
MSGEFSDKRVTVYGLGRFGGGIGVSRWLTSQGAKVLVTDREPAEKLLDSIQALDGLPVQLVLGEQRKSDFTSCDLLVISPAIPPRDEFVKAARAAGVPVTTEIRLFIERCPATIVGVTATKGKSTTTTMLGMMLKTRFNTFVGGNLGGSLLPELPNMQKSDIVVLELSSYMLEHLGAARWSPHLALIGMIGLDHVEWHGSADAYLNAKKNIVRFQRPDDWTVVNEHSAAALSFADETRAKIVHYGARDAETIPLVLAGKHNQLNAQGALAAAMAMGVAREDAVKAVRSFAGLPHRLQLVHEQDGVRWINDSIATVPEAAVAAMQAYAPQNVIQIVGGYDKGLDMTFMCRALARGCQDVLSIGDLGPKLAGMIRATSDAKARVTECRTLDRAVAMARKVAEPGDVVLLSPGCASYDQFPNFERRGELFAKLAAAPHTAGGES